MRQHALIGALLFAGAGAQAAPVPLSEDELKAAVAGKTVAIETPLGLPITVNYGVKVHIGRYNRHHCRTGFNARPGKCHARCSCRWWQNGVAGRQQEEKNSTEYRVHSTSDSRNRLPVSCLLPDQWSSFARFLFHRGIRTTRSCVPFGTHWQLSRDSGCTSRAVSSMSSSFSVAGVQLFSPCRT